jgi:hypothetical protein
VRWPPDRQKLLADLSARGLSAADIARLTGESVNAVKGAMWRYGLFARSRSRQSFDTVAIAVMHLGRER